MSGFSVKIGTFGDWEGASNAVRWLNKGLDRAIERSLRTEARRLKKLMQENLRKGGSPSFAKIAPFTRAVRRALGVSSRRPGIATGQVLRAIDVHKIDSKAFFVGVKRGQAHIDPSGNVEDIADVASRLELGRKKFYLELDRAGRSGKTPRQWLWWLYLSGVIKSPPRKSTTHIEIGAAPARPFVGQIFEEESKYSSRFVEESISEAFFNEYMRF